MTEDRSIRFSSSSFFGNEPTSIGGLKRMGGNNDGANRGGISDGIISGLPSTNIEEESSAPLFSLNNFVDGNLQKLVIPLAGVGLLVAFLLVLVVNYFLHMRRNGFFKRHRKKRTNRSKSEIGRTDSSDRENLVNLNDSDAANNSNSDQVKEVTDPLLTLELPPLPSPKLEYEYGTQYHVPSPQTLQNCFMANTPLQQYSEYSLTDSPSGPAPKMMTVVSSAQQLQEHQRAKSANSVLPLSLSQPAVVVTNAPNVDSTTVMVPEASSPSKQGLRPNSLYTQRPSSSSIRSSNRGSNERVVSVQESFDSAYEVRLYDELPVETPQSASRSHSKRAPLLKVESLSDEPMLPTGRAASGAKVPQTLIIAHSDSSGSSSFIPRQSSVGGDLSPVAEQPVEHGKNIAMGGNVAAPLLQGVFPASLSTVQPSSSQSSTIAGKSTQTSSPSITPTTSGTSPVGQSNKKTLLSIFKEKRVTLLEHVKSMSPTKSENPGRVVPAPVPQPQQLKPTQPSQRPSQQLMYKMSSGSGSGGMQLAVRPTESQRPSSGYSQYPLPTPYTMPIRGTGRGAGRGRSRGGIGGAQGEKSVNANMLMRLSGNRGADG